MMAPKQVQKMMPMLMMFNMMNHENQEEECPCPCPCQSPQEVCCNNSCGPCKKPFLGNVEEFLKASCEGKGEQKPVCLNKYPCCQPFAGFQQNGNWVVFGKMGNPQDTLKFVKEGVCTQCSHANYRIIMLCIDECHDDCNSTLREIVECKSNVSVIRVWTDAKGEFNVSHYQKAIAECAVKKEEKEEKKA